MATKTYVVTADRFRRLKVNDSGKVTGSTRYFKGDEVKMDEADARRLVVTGGLIEANSDVAGEVVAEVESLDGQKVTVAAVSGATASEVNYEAMSYSDLQDLAKDRGVQANGSRAELVTRLNAADAEAAAEVEGDNENVADDSGTE